MNNYFWIALTAVFLLVTASAIGQSNQDSIATSEVNQDSLASSDVRPQKWVPKPKKAALLSLIPGVGQIYNRKYAWIKVPIIYGGFIGVGLGARFNQNTYEGYRDAYVLSVNGMEHAFGNASSADLKRARDRFDKFRQQTYVAMGAIYLAQIIEAYVAAHLIDFDIDDDLSLELKPTFQQEYHQGLGFGALLTF